MKRFDLGKRLAQLESLGDPLPRLHRWRTTKSLVFWLMWTIPVLMSGADAAYRSNVCERALKGAGYRSHIHTTGQANRPISACQQRANRKRSKTRCRVFAAQRAMGGKLVGTIGLARVRVKIAMMNIVYNLCRWNWLQTAASPNALR